MIDLQGFLSHEFATVRYAFIGVDNLKHEVRFRLVGYILKAAPPGQLIKSTIYGLLVALQHHGLGRLERLGERCEWSVRLIVNLRNRSRTQEQCDHKCFYHCSNFHLALPLASALYFPGGKGDSLNCVIFLANVLWLGRLQPANFPFLRNKLPSSGPSQSETFWTNNQ